MAEKDRQTDKTTRWQFTAYEGQWSLFRDIKLYTDVAEWGWQTEQCPKTNNLHYQGWFRTRRQMRLSAVRKLFPGVHLEVAREWFALRNYSKKSATAIEGTHVEQKNEQEFYSMQRALCELASYEEEWQEYFETIRDLNHTTAKLENEDYWFRVRRILTGRPELSSTFAAPVMKTMWVNTKPVWYAEETRAIVLQPAPQESEEMPQSPTARIEIISPAQV